MEDFLKLSTLAFVSLLTPHLLANKSILLVSLLTFYITVIHTWFYEKSQVMDALKVYIVEIDRQLDRKVTQLFVIIECGAR